MLNTKEKNRAPSGESNGLVVSKPATLPENLCEMTFIMAGADQSLVPAGGINEVALGMAYYKGRSDLTLQEAVRGTIAKNNTKALLKCSRLGYLKLRDERSLMATLTFLIAELGRSISTFKGELSTSATMPIAYKIISKYPHLNLEEIIYAFERGTEGNPNYPHKSGGLDQPTILKWLEYYDVNERSAQVGIKRINPLHEEVTPAQIEQLPKAAKRNIAFRAREEGKELMKEPVVPLYVRHFDTFGEWLTYRRRSNKNVNTNLAWAEYLYRFSSYEEGAAYVYKTHGQESEEALAYMLQTLFEHFEKEEKRLEEQENLRKQFGKIRKRVGNIYENNKPVRELTIAEYLELVKPFAVGTSLDGEELLLLALLYQDKGSTAFMAAMSAPELMSDPLGYLIGELAEVPLYDEEVPMLKQVFVEYGFGVFRQIIGRYRYRSGNAADLAKRFHRVRTGERIATQDAIAYREELRDILNKKAANES